MSSAGHKRRPAVVVSVLELAEVHGLLWVLMVTSAANRPWPQDVAIPDLAAAGLPKPSVVRVSQDRHGGSGAV